MQLARPHSIPEEGETTALVTYPHYHLFVMLCPKVTGSGLLCKDNKGHLSIPYDLLSVLALGKSEFFE